MLPRFLTVLLLLLATGAAAQPCTTVQLCIALDGSGSISASNFDLMKTGLADAIRDGSIVPRDGNVQLSVIQFGGQTRTEIAATVINSDPTANTFANQLQAIAKVDGSTPIDQAVDLCASLLNKTCPGRQVINIVTDGEPDNASAAVTARQNAVNAGVDEVNAEAVAAPATAFTFLRDQLVWPQPGYEAPPFSGGGFVIKTDTFEDFAEAVRGKIGSIVGPTTGCTIDPPSANNPVGTEHSFIVTVKKDGQPQPDIPLTVTIMSGPNAGGSGSNTTRADGTIEAMYTSNGVPGTDTIRVTGMLDAPFSCTATKTWTPPTCSIEPPTASNPFGERHDMTVTVRKADGTVAPGVAVTVEVTAGPNAPASGTFNTDGNGFVDVFYTGNGGQGTDTIEARGTIDGAPFSCTATKTWTAPQPRCSIAPDSDVNPINTQHQFTVTVTFAGGPIAGLNMTVSILSGPNSPDSGNATTDSNGEIDVLYAGDGGPGTDTIRASGTFNGINFFCTATKTWVLPPPVCNIAPMSDTNPVGTRHDMTVTVTRGGVPQSGVGVTVDITSGPNSPDRGTFVTGPDGQVDVFYNSNGLPGTDSITASGAITGIPFSCNATKLWVAPTATITRTVTRTRTPTRTPTASRTSSPTRTATRTSTGAPTASPTRTATGVPSFTPSRTPTLTATGVPSATPTRTPTLTRTPSRTPTVSPTDTREPKPTFTPTFTFTHSRTETPTLTPMSTATVPPGSTETRTATRTATLVNTATATASPVNTATASPTLSPTFVSSATPTASATIVPSASPTQSPAQTATATGSPTITGTRKDTFTPTRTPTVSPTFTATELGGATATPSESPTPDIGTCSCVGDCNCDDVVTIDEIVTMVNLAITGGDIGICPAADPSDDAIVTVDEILTAISNALDGC